MTDASTIREYLEWRAGREGIPYGTSPEEFALENATLDLIAIVGGHLQGLFDNDVDLAAAYERYNMAVEALSASQ